MLDQFDYQIAVDDFLEANPDVATRVTSPVAFHAVWYLLAGNVSYPRIGKPDLDLLDGFLRKEKYYERNGKRPTNLNVNNQIVL